MRRAALVALLVCVLGACGSDGTTPAASRPLPHRARVTGVEALPVPAAADVVERESTCTPQAAQCTEAFYELPSASVADVTAWYRDHIDFSVDWNDWHPCFPDDYRQHVDGTIEWRRGTGTTADTLLLDVRRSAAADAVTIQLRRELFTGEDAGTSCD